MGTSERKEREKESRRESIIDAAQKVFFEKGLLLSTMDEIAESAELAKGTLYHYYHSKEDLYLTVTMRGLTILHSSFDKILGRKFSVVRTMVELTQAYTNFAQQHSNYFRMLHFFNTPQFHKQVSPEVMHACDTFNHTLWAMVVSVINTGIAEKKIRAGLNPAEISLIMWSNATSLLLRIDDQYEMFKQKMNIDLHETLKMSNTLFLESIFTDPGKKELHEVLKYH